MREDRDCECLPNRTGYDRVDDELCDIPCPDGEFLEKSTKFCGGADRFFSFFQEYDFDNTGQGCLDPWRRIWYQSVAIHMPPDPYYNELGMSAGAPVLEWHLHASNLDTGDPLFQYNQRLPSMLHGIQYDLDQSRVVGHMLPYWSDKAAFEAWEPELLVLRMNSSINTSITWNQTTIPFNLTFNSTAEIYFLATATTSLDSTNNMYYFAAPEVPIYYDTKDLYSQTNFSSRIYGVSLDPWAEHRVALHSENMSDHRLVNFQANSRYDDGGLYAMLVEDGHVPHRDDEFVYVAFGQVPTSIGHTRTRVRRSSSASVSTALGASRWAGWLSTTTRRRRSSWRRKIQTLRSL